MRDKKSLIEHGFTCCALDPSAFVLRMSGKIHGVLGVHVDDVIGGGDEIFDRIMTVVRKEFDFRQISQMPNGEIVFDIQQHKHELEQIEVSTEKTSLSPELKRARPIARRSWGVSAGLCCVENNPHRQFKICLSRSGVFQWNSSSTWFSKFLS